MPDITGFTAFVNKTEVAHSQHIISELLELLIESDELNLEVSEVEGDAVLFYGKDFVPPITAIIEQAERMFINFHNHLKQYEVRRICQCGACSSAVDLSLKMVAHAGEFGFTTVHNHSKPFGADLVLVHRLLKNDIDIQEYLLLTDRFENELKAEGAMPPWAQWSTGHTIYDKLGKVNYRYLPLKPLHEKVEEPTPPSPPKKAENPYKHVVYIEKAAKDVFEMITNLEMRLLWNKGIEDLIYEEGKINRMGMRHRCLFPVGKADIETVPMAGTEGGEMVYGEQMKDFKMAEQVNLYYILKGQNGGCRLEIQFHYFPLPWIGWMISPVIKTLMKKRIKEMGKALKKLCESS